MGQLRESSGERDHRCKMAGMFKTTQWSMVLAAADSQSPDSGRALETLCETYWYPIYAHIRYLVRDSDRAQDLTQGFFAHILEKRSLKIADPDRGRFRAFLKTTLHHYMSNERHRAEAAKRGAGQTILSLDFAGAENRYSQEPASDRSPDKAFEQRWAQAMVARCLHRLRAELKGTAAERFAHLEPFLTGSAATTGYKDIAARLDMSESAVKVAVHRLRKRFGDILRAAVTQTVDRPADVEGEIRYLLAAIAS